MGTCIPFMPRYNDGRGRTAAHFGGIIAVINAFVPTIMFWAWIYRKAYEVRTNNILYWVSWNMFWGFHLVMYLVPALTWPFAFVKDKVKWVYTHWFRWIYYVLFGVYGLIGIFFFVAMLEHTETQETPLYEVVLVSLLYYGIGAVDIY